MTFAGHYSQFWAIIISPLFFGVAHFHHMVERIRKGWDPLCCSSTSDNLLMFRAGRSHLVPGVDVPIRLHHHLRDVLSVPLHKNRTLCCSVCCTRLLQLYGVSRLHGGCKLRAKEEDVADDSVRGRSCPLLSVVGASHQAAVVQQRRLHELGPRTV